jgi:integrase/recombinase XerD
MWEHELGEYRKQLAARGLARDTVRHRGNMVGHALAFFAAAGVSELTEITQDRIDAYLAYLATEYRTAKGTPITVVHLRAHHLCVKDFFSWLEREGRVLRSPYGARELPHRVLPARLPSVLTSEEAVRVLESVSPASSQGLRDRAMLEILYSTGMRKGELVALNVADFSFERQELVIVKSRSRKGRVVPVGEYARHFTEAYLKAVRPWLARNDEEKALFVRAAFAAAGGSPCGPSGRSWKGWRR